jgi:hypothetical protein
MTGPDGEPPPHEPLVKRGKGVNSTSRETETGQVFTTHQRSDLRWFYRLDGRDSEKTYPTAGEAERGAIAALRAAAKSRPDTWKWWMVIAAACAPVIYALYVLGRMLTDR